MILGISDVLPETWGAYIIAILGVLGAAHAKYDARCVARDKRDGDIAQAKITAEHDATIVQLKAEVAICKEHHEDVKQDLKDCNAARIESERDREAIWKALTDLKAQVPGRAPSS